MKGAKSVRKQVLENSFFGFLLLVCIFYLCFGLMMPIGSVSQPGSGFLPAVLGTAGVIFCVALIFRNVLRKNQEKIEDFAKTGPMRFLGYVIVLILFLATYKWLGYVGLGLMVLCLSKINGFRGWLYPVLFTAVFTAFIYVLFAVLLVVPLPTGIFL
jgi:hypothetical protein